MPISSDLLSGHTTVQASAGSGKTYLLVSRVIRLLITGTTPGNILAITFTRKAANEMHVRLLERLYQLAKATDEELKRTLTDLQLQPTQEYLQRTKGLYESLLRSPFPVKTSTFHSFCQELLRKFPMEANVPPGFNLLEQTAILYEQAWESLMSDAATNKELGQHIKTLFSKIGLPNTKTALSSFINHRSDWWAYTGKEKVPVKYAINKLKTLLDVDPDYDYVAELMSDEIFMHKCSEFNQLIVKNATKTNLEHSNHIALSLDSSLEISSRFSSICIAFLTKDNTARKRKASERNDKLMGEQGAQKFLQLHDEISERLINTLALLRAQQSFQLCTAWYHAGNQLLLLFQQIKQEQRLLDFTDLEWKAFELLNNGKNAMWVQFKLDEKIEHLLVDEFQDTNPTQWHLILPLLEELAASENNQQRSVFLVGDAKQSIYRFRRAEPRLFESASQWLSSHLNANTCQLSHSWRSSPAIIEMVNRVFSSESFASMMPDFQLHETHKDTLLGNVNLLPISKAETKEDIDTQHDSLRNPLERPAEENIQSNFYDEGLIVGQKILSLIENETPVAEDKTSRAINYNDIIILLRNRTHVSEYERALKKLHIPYIGADKGTLLECIEIKDMLDLLQWLILPFDDLSLAGILRSPVFSFADNDLIALSKINHTNWLKRLEALSAKQPENKLYQYTYNTLVRWQSLANHLPVHDLLDKIYSEANVIERYSAAFPSHLKARVNANLHRFLELALEMDSGRYPSLTRFACWLQELAQLSHDAPDEPVAQTDGQRVRIMSIHAAKGLESAVVFLVDATTVPSSKNAYSTLVDWPAENSSPDYFLLSGTQDTNAEFTRARIAKQQLLEQREDANLLYVALTRAKQQLFISGTQKNNKIAGWYKKIMAAFDISDEDIRSEYQLTRHGTETGINKNVISQEIKNIAEVDANLSKPIPISNIHQDISPSQSDSLFSQHLSSNHLEKTYAQNRGVVIHQMMDILAKNAKAIFSPTLFRSQYDFDQDTLKDWWEKCHSLVTSQDLAPLFDNTRYDKCYSEVPIQFTQDNKLVFGIIDRIVIKGSQVLLVDYKTHTHANKNNIPEISKDYQQQMQLYSDGCNLLWPDFTVVPQLLFTECGILHNISSQETN